MDGDRAFGCRALASRGFRMSQSQQILEHLKSGGTLTPLEALSKFQCWALSSRCSDLKKEGHPIKSTLVKINGKLVAMYSYQYQEDKKGQRVFA